MEIRTELTAKVPYFLIRTLCLTSSSVLSARFEKNQIIIEVIASKPNLPVNQSVKLYLNQDRWAKGGYEEGYYRGLNKGIEEGFRLGQENCSEYQDGFIEGYEKGVAEGSQAGKRRGYAAGYWQGYKTAKADTRPDMLRYVAMEEKADDEEETEDSLDDED